MTAVRAVVEIDHAIASPQAMRAQLLAGIGHVAIDDARAEHLDPGIGLRDVAAELALRQRRHDRTVEAELDRAMVEREQWPATLRAWGEAKIHRGHVAVIAEIGAALAEPEARAAFEAAVLPRAESTSPGRLRAIARRELERHLVEPLAARHGTARDRRGVFLRDLDDGVSMVQSIMPTVLAHGALDRLTQMARAATRAGDPRTFDQLRAGIVADLLLTADPTGLAVEGIAADVSIVIPAGVLTGTLDGSDDGGDNSGCIARLPNGAAVDPETARLLAQRVTAWARLFTDPVTGHVTAVDTYVPSKRMKRLLRARDQHCRWPGCGQKAARCDIDHTIPWADGGTTETGNLTSS